MRVSSSVTPPTAAVFTVRVLSVANRGYVLETGEIKLSDNAAALRENDEVRKLYLGEA